MMENIEQVRYESANSRKKIMNKIKWYFGPKKKNIKEETMTRASKREFFLTIEKRKER
jgi:hypothetical protein